MAIRRDITGMRSGKLTAIKWHSQRGTGRNTHHMWICQCDCGRQSIVAIRDITKQLIKSCRCRPRKPPIKNPTWKGRPSHGHRGTKGSGKTPTYQSWDHMRSRCNNQKDVSYHLYGAIGVIVCKRWAKFANFLVDMGECPAGMTLDRFPDPAGNYEPENCRWATPTQQSRNTKKNARKKPTQLFLEF